MPRREPVALTRLSPASAAPIKKGADVPVRSVDIHAHYYPEEFLHLLGSEGKTFGASYTRQDTTFSFSTPAGGLGPLPLKFIDVQARLLDMDRSGVDVQRCPLACQWCTGQIDNSMPAWHVSGTMLRRWSIANTHNVLWCWPRCRC